MNFVRLSMTAYLPQRSGIRKPVIYFVFLFLDDFVVLFDQFGEIPSDELPERAVVEPEPPGQRLHAFGCRAVQVHGLAVFLHAAAGHRAARIRPDHSLPGIQFRLVFLQVAAERFRVAARTRRRPVPSAARFLSAGGWLRHIWPLSRGCISGL